MLQSCPQDRTKSSLAGAAFQRESPALPFAETWSSVKVRRCGRYRSVKDIVVEIDTVKAGRALPTIGQRIPNWFKRFDWPDGSCASFNEFAGGRGGGRPGGCRGGPECCSEMNPHVSCTVTPFKDPHR